MQKLRNQIKKTDHVGIHHILFDQPAGVTLLGFRIAAGRQEPMNYLINFEQFDKLLRNSGKDGEDIQVLLVEKLTKATEHPSIIDLNTQLGHSVLLNQCIMEVSPAWSQNSRGDWGADPKCLSIDAVYPIGGKRNQNISLQAKYRQTLVECEELLAKSYSLYLGYLELEMEEEAALKQAGLEDDLKFKMAYNAWKMNQTAA